MAIGCHAATAGTQIVVRAGSIKRRRDVGVPGQVLAELVLPGRSDHIGLVVIRGEKASSAISRQNAVIGLTGIARRAEGMGPAEMHAVYWRDWLAQERPRPPARSLVLEGEFARHIAVHVLDDGADDRPCGFKLIQRADLGGILVGDVPGAHRKLEVIVQSIAVRG